MPDEDKTFSGFLVLDLRIWWRQVHTLYRLIELREKKKSPRKFYVSHPYTYKGFLVHVSFITSAISAWRIVDRVLTRRTGPSSSLTQKNIGTQDVQELFFCEFKAPELSST